MTTGIKALFSALLILGSLNGSAQPLNLKEAVQFALDHSPVVDEAKRTHNIATLQRENIFAQFLPSLDFTTSDGLEQLQPPGPTDPYTSSLNLSLTENLYDNGQSITQYKIAKLTEEASEVSYNKNRDQISLNVAQQFYNYSLNMKLYAVRKEQLKILRHQLEMVTNQYRQGFKTRKDFLRMKSQVQTAQISLFDAQNASDTAISELRRILGAHVEEKVAEHLEFQLIEPADQEPLLPDGKLSVENTFDHQLLTLNGKINDLNVNLSVRNYWPQVKLNISGIYENANFIGPTTSSTSTTVVNTPAGFVTGSQEYGWTGLITLSYNIWDWGTRKRNVEIAENNRDLSNDQFRDTLLSTGRDIRNLLLDLTRLHTEYQLQKDLFVADQEIYDLLEADYREGKVTYLDLITSLSDLLTSKISYYTAYFNLLTDVAVYRYNEGTLNETIFRR